MLPFVLKRPFWGILLSAWLGYMNPHLLCYGFMQSMPVVQIVAIATLIGMLASKEAKRMVWSRETVVLVIFIMWMGITTTQAFYLEAAVDQYIKVMKIQILTFMALLLLTSREKVDLFVWVIVLSLGFYGVKGGVFTIANGGSYRVQGPGGFIGGNNELALALTMTIPLMRYLHLQALYLLSEKGHIRLGTEKTNYQYAAELRKARPVIARPFADLTYKYEYIWYGEYMVTDAMYTSVRGSFSEFNNEIS